MSVLFNADLLSVGIAIAANIIIGVAVLFSNRSSATNRIFFVQTVILAIWSATNYISYQSHNPETALLLVRLVLFFAVPNSICFFMLMHTFPEESLRMKRWVYYILLAITLITMALTLSPFVFSHVVISNNSAPTPVPAPGILLFAIVAILSIPIGIFYLIRNYYRAPKGERGPYGLLITGVVLMFSCIIALDFLLPSFLGNSRFIPLSAVFTFPFVILTAYAIYRDKAFKVREIGTVALAFSLSLVTLVQLIFASTLPEFILYISVFTLALIISIQLLRKTFELEISNERQEGLIHFISHEVKGFLTKDQGSFAALVEGDLGPLPANVVTFVKEALAQTREEVDSVTDILKASNQKQGTVTYKKLPFDFAALAARIVEEAEVTAHKKGLILTFIADSSDKNPYMISGDEKEIGDHVLRNLIDNSINYTPSGSIDVSLKKEKGKYIFAVKDTGVGISDEDKARLFTEGGHGKESQKVNVHSTGYGLYIAKNIVLAHGGTIRAESDGPGKGSTFIVELPA